jgi:hypothetical protein
MTNSPIHVLLGYRDGSGHECLDSLSLRLTSANGQVFDFVQIGFPIAGTIGLVNEVISPHKEWTTDISLRDFMGDLHGKPLINPIAGDKLAWGRYRLQALFKGESSTWPPQSLPYWTGILESNSIDYQVP